eukprot:534156_1
MSRANRGFNPLNVIHENKVFVNTARSTSQSVLDDGIQIAIDEISDSVQIDNNEPPLIPPRLEKRNAVHVRKVQIESPQKLHDDAGPNYDLLEQYKKYPYINHGKLVIAGYIREIDSLIVGVIPSVIQSMCMDFSYDDSHCVFELGYLVSKIVQENRKNVQNHNVHSINIGLSGFELVSKIRKSIKGFNANSDDRIISYCHALIKSKFIRPIATNFAFGGVFDTLFSPSSKYLYEFSSSKSHLFSCYDGFRYCRDRMAWSIGTVVKINSNCSGWKLGQIIEMNDKKK